MFILAESKNFEQCILFASLCMYYPSISILKLGEKA